MQRFLTARIAEVQYDENVWMPAYDAANREGDRQIPSEISARQDALTDDRCTAEEALIFTPTDTLGNVIWKIAYARQRWEDFCDWPDDWWNAVMADLHRIEGSIMKRAAQ